MSIRGASVLGILAASMVTVACGRLGIGSRKLANKPIGVIARYDSSWSVDALGRRPEDSNIFTIFKVHPGRTAMTMIEVKKMPPEIRDLRDAYENQFGERDLTLVEQAHSQPPVFETATLYGFPGLRVKSPSAPLEEIRVFNKGGEIVMVEFQVLNDPGDSRYLSEGMAIVDGLDFKTPTGQ